MPGASRPPVDRTLNLDDLRLLHHWHRASEDEDFAPFVDHARVDRKREYDEMIQLSFEHPYLLHILLALAALHKLNGMNKADEELYQLASAHGLAAMRLARPQVGGQGEANRRAVFSFAAFASLYATAEPPLRTGDGAITTPASAITGLLDAFKMSKGVRAVQDPFIDELKSSGAIKPGLWKDNRDEIIPTLEADYPQLHVINQLITKHCDETQLRPCLDAARLLFISIGIFAVNHKNHSSLRLVQTWPMDVDAIYFRMLEAHHPVALVILAHYAALMSMRSNYWFFARWPPLLLDSAIGLLPAEWHLYVDWPKELIRGSME